MPIVLSQYKRRHLGSVATLDAGACFLVLVALSGCGQARAISRWCAPGDQPAPIYDQSIGAVHAAVIRAILTQFDRVALDDRIHHHIQASEGSRWSREIRADASLEEHYGATTVSLMVEAKQDAWAGDKFKRILDQLTIEMSRTGVAR